MPSAKVSIVTAVFNGEPYFGRAVPSVLAQTFSDFEFIVVDDGSTDRTSELLEDLGHEDSRFRILSPGRIGFSAALNYGIARAQGKYIARQDFDDISYPERLALQVEFLDQNRDVGLVGGCYVLDDENRGERYVRRPPVDHPAIVRALCKAIPFAHTCVMFRKAAWSEAGGYPEVEDIEDLRLWIEFVRLGWRLANLPEVIGEHLVHADSYWHRNFRYRQRQRTLQRVQWQAVRRLGLPLWMGIYPLGRYFYSFLPARAKKTVRRTIGASDERDLESG